MSDESGGGGGGAAADFLITLAFLWWPEDDDTKASVINRSCNTTWAEWVVRQATVSSSSSVCTSEDQIGLLHPSSSRNSTAKLCQIQKEKIKLRETEMIVRLFCIFFFPLNERTKNKIKNFLPNALHASPPPSTNIIMFNSCVPVRCSVSPGGEDKF